MCGVQPAIEPAKVELAVSAPLRSVQAEVPRTSWVSAPLRSAQSRGPLDLVGLRSAPVGPGRGPPDLVDPLRPNGVSEPVRGRKFE